MSYVPWSLTSQKMGGGGYSLNLGDLFPRVTEEMKARQMVPDWEKQRVPLTHLCPVPTAGCWELVNTWCSLVTLTAHLRQRGQVPPDATIALLAEDGHLVSLDEGASQAPSMGSPLLQERGTYVLVQIISKWGPRFPLGVMLGCERGTAVRDHPRPGPAPHFGQDLDLTLPIQCLVDPSQGQQIGRVRGEGGNHQASQESVLLPPQRGRMGPPPATSPFWRTWMTSVQSSQVSLTLQPQGEGAPSPQLP
ncbi:uncharacterized protein C22orf15 homolog isoform X1 [Felis catus]|uniref:uncharacterized protein C22orf15 homolog isoform X1 n=1 Tax=Felis catus TaxID=9685 RepID=UPI001D1A3070|nr:uncharacterized protein C22orf15 homolog isoform X1 [Felis catus]